MSFLQHQKKKSLKIEVLLIVFLTCVPVIGALFGINNSAIRLIEDKIYDTNLDILNLNMKRLDTELSQVYEYLHTQSEKGEYIREMVYGDSTEQYYASFYYMERFQENTDLFSYVEGMMVYSPVSGARVYRYNTNSDSYEQRSRITAYVEENCRELVAGQNIITCRIDGLPVLLCISGNENICFCAWLCYDNLIDQITDWNFTQDGLFCCVSEDGTVLSVSDGQEISDITSLLEDEKYLTTTGVSSTADFSMVNLVEKKEILGIFYYLRLYGWGILIVYLLVMVPVLFYLLNKRVFHPVRMLEEGIRKVEGGNLDTRISAGDSSLEIEHLIGTFNNMVGEIKELKIETYEKELEQQKLQLDYLQLQIEPHFYLNALNLINTMAQMGDTELIGRLSRTLSGYFRYIVKSRERSVTVREELEHIRNYLNIMEIRFGDSFQYLEDVDEGFMEMRIPPLMLQMIIENSMKYAFDVYGDTRISLSVKKDGTVVCMAVADNGDGYPEAILEAFEKNEPPQGNHIGLWNLQKRLKYMYGERADFCIMNQQPKGARTEIRIRPDNTGTPQEFAADRENGSGEQQNEFIDRG